MIYLDSSALLKLVIDEPESAALEEWLAPQSGTPAVSSELAKVEVLRACRRLNPDVLPEARALLAGLNLLPLAGPVVDEAAVVDGDVLRSLDGLHLASALSIRHELTAFVAYNDRLEAAATAAGLPCTRPTGPTDR